MNEIVVFDTQVSRDSRGRFSLNDIHKAAMAKGLAGENQRPRSFLQSDRIANCINVLNQTARKRAVETGEKQPAALRTREGKGGGSYAVKPLALAYITWLGGPSSHLKLMESLSDAAALIQALWDFEIPDDLPDLYVYAIREAETGHVKLGISRDPQARLSQLQTGNSQKLELVAYRKAGNRFADEAVLHREFRRQRIRGEWFSQAAATAISMPA